MKARANERRKFTLSRVQPSVHDFNKVKIMKKFMMSVVVMIMTGSMTMFGNTTSKPDKNNNGKNDQGWNINQGQMNQGMNDRGMNQGDMKTYQMGGKKEMTHKTEPKKHLPKPEPKPQPVHHNDGVTTGVVVGTILVTTLTSLLK